MEKINCDLTEEKETIVEQKVSIMLEIKECAAQASVSLNREIMEEMCICVQEHI